MSGFIDTALGWWRHAEPRVDAATAGGVNDASCRPSAMHPYPVVFLHVEG